MNQRYRPHRKICTNPL